MSKHILLNDKGKKVIVEIKKDVFLYMAPVNPSGTGSTYTRGTDLLAHKAKSGTIYFYRHYWSMWQGEEDEFALIDRVEAEEFLIRKAGLGGHAAITENDLKKIEELGFDLMDETA